MVPPPFLNAIWHHLMCYRQRLLTPTNDGSNSHTTTNSASTSNDQQQPLSRRDECLPSEVCKYWPAQSLDELITEADHLYEQKRYMLIYERLNRQRFCHSANVNIKWRVARALYQMSNNPSISAAARRDMIQEAYELINDTTTGQSEQMLQPAETVDAGRMHTWTAVIMHRWAQLVGGGVARQLHMAPLIKVHLQRAVDLNPHDFAANYLLGKWCYDMSNFSWLQRLILQIFYGHRLLVWAEPPTTSLPQQQLQHYHPLSFANFQEAHMFLAKAEELRPCFHIENTYLLAKTCLNLGHFYRAKYYLESMVNAEPHNQKEVDFIADAHKILKKLRRYSAKSRSNTRHM